jgi:hypothetical protein
MSCLAHALDQATEGLVEGIEDSWRASRVALKGDPVTGLYPSTMAAATSAEPDTKGSSAETQQNGNDFPPLLLGTLAVSLTVRIRHLLSNRSSATNAE